MTAPLTRRQAEIVDFLRRYRTERGISPTLEEIARHLGVHRVTVFGHIRELERKGVIRRGEPGVSRSITLAESTRDPATRLVPILGRIAAGAPLEAIEEPETLDLSAWLPRDRDVYALRVRGESMIEDGIQDGDIVIIEHRTEARDGETVVAVLPGEEATLKRFYREADGYRLEPANAAFEPIHTKSLEIRGVVIGVVRQY